MADATQAPEPLISTSIDVDRERRLGGGGKGAGSREGEDGRELSRRERSLIARERESVSSLLYNSALLGSRLLSLKFKALLSKNKNISPTKLSLAQA